MAKTNALILGAGMVGSVMAADLAADENFKVTIADRSRRALDHTKEAARVHEAAVETIVADLSDVETLKRLVAPHDIVLGALASAIGYQTLQAVIDAGKPYCDISFMPENALDLDGLAKDRGVTAIVDCGVAPGMSNLLAGYGASLLDRCERIEIYVGGIPREPKPPFRYKAAFSPADVIEEYTRPARFVEGGRIVTRDALSEQEIIEFPGVGAIEAFNTDGLRSIMFTLDAPYMKEKTLRWPGHVDLMRVFRDGGLFSKEPVVVPAAAAGGGRSRATSDASDHQQAAVRPLDVTSAVLFPHWTYEEGEEDITVMRVIVAGEKEGRDEQFSWDLLDRFDKASRQSSMARTTALPATIVARMLASGRIDAGPGVIVPEMIGLRSGVVQEILAALAERGITFTSTRSNPPQGI